MHYLSPTCQWLTRRLSKMTTNDSPYIAGASFYSSSVQAFWSAKAYCTMHQSGGQWCRETTWLEFYAPMFRRAYFRKRYYFASTQPCWTICKSAVFRLRTVHWPTATIPIPCKVLWWYYDRHCLQQSTTEYILGNGRGPVFLKSLNFRVWWTQKLSPDNPSCNGATTALGGTAWTSVQPLYSICTMFVTFLWNRL